MLLVVVKMTSAGEPCLEDSPSMACVEGNRQLLAVKRIKGTVDTTMEENSTASKAVADDHQAGLTAIAIREQKHQRDSDQGSVTTADPITPYELPGTNTKVGVYFGRFTTDTKKLCVTPWTRNHLGRLDKILPLECKKGNKSEVIKGKAPKTLKVEEDQNNNICASVDYLPAGITRLELHLACLRKPTPAPTPRPTPAPAKEGWSDCYVSIGKINRDWRIQEDCEKKNLKWKTGDDYKYCWWPPGAYAGWCHY